VNIHNEKPIRVADWIMQKLASEKVQHVFLLPGGGAMHLNDALACEPRLTPVPCHHEQACGIAAEAYGRTNPAGFGVAMVTTGPGATNILTPVAGAWIESLPLLVISGQVKRPDALNGRPLRQSGVQEVDIVAMVRPVTKFALTVQRPEDIRKNLEEALWQMRSGRPGPVWLDIPLDVQAAPVSPESLAGFEPEPIHRIPMAMDQQIENINALLMGSKRPLILVGHGVRIAGAADLLKQVAEKLGIPCVFTWNAADMMHWDHPLYVGRPGVVAARAPNFAIQNCDCLIVIGCRMDNIITAYNPKGFARYAKKIVVDIDANELSRHEMPIEVSVHADAKSFLESWMARPAVVGPWEPWRQICQDWKSRYLPLEGKVFKPTGPISHFHFAEALSQAIPEDYLVITGSSGLAVEVFYTAFRNKKGQRMFLTSGLGSMGYGVPAAIGACEGARRKPTVCVESDGSLMLNLQELVTLKQMGLPMTLIIMNNNGYASIRNTQKNYFEGRYVGSSPQSGLLIPDFMALAEALGIECVRVTKVEGINPTLFSDRLRVVEIILEENEVLAPKVSALPQADGSIISMPLEDMSPLLPRDVLRAEMLVPLDPASEKIDA
jgi:acetolactate synthase-1/2/3 large subunit